MKTDVGCVQRVRTRGLPRWVWLQVDGAVHIFPTNATREGVVEYLAQHGWELQADDTVRDAQRWKDVLQHLSSKAMQQTH